MSPEVAEQTPEAAQVMTPEDLFHQEEPQPAKLAHKPKSDEAPDVALIP